MVKKILAAFLLFALVLAPTNGFSESKRESDGIVTKFHGNFFTNQGKEQGQNQGKEQGQNQGKEQGQNQGEEQGQNQSEEQGQNQSEEQGENQGENQSDEEQEAPKGDLPGWKQVFVDDFEEYGNVPVGSFSDCDNNSNNFPQAFCGGLPDKLKERWWAYPKGWPDTAKQRNYEHGGVYNPDETVSIENGQLKVRMFNNGGDNQVAALVPKATIGQTYGRYVIRFKAETTPGYKLAWLLWPDKDEECPGCEIDFPELELDSEITGFVHHKLSSMEEKDRQDSYPTGQKYGEWHTAVIEWKPEKIEFFLDGKKVKGINSEGNPIDASTQGVPDKPMTWVIQSESALDERAKNNQVVAAEGSSATILIDWVAAYQYTGDGAEDETVVENPGVVGRKETVEETPEDQEEK